MTHLVFPCCPLQHLTLFWTISNFTCFFFVCLFDGKTCHFFLSLCWQFERLLIDSLCWKMFRQLSIKPGVKFCKYKPQLLKSCTVTALHFLLFTKFFCSSAACINASLPYRVYGLNNFGRLHFGFSELGFHGETLFVLLSWPIKLSVYDTEHPNIH